MTVINMTPHIINLIGENNEVVMYLPSNGIARAHQSRAKVDEIDLGGNTVAINRNVFGELSGLPEPQDGVFYIVSALAAKAAPGRKDLLLVDETVRDENNQIVGCRAFARPN